jgi:hypothetical protein
MIRSCQHSQWLESDDSLPESAAGGGILTSCYTRFTGSWTPLSDEGLSLFPFHAVFANSLLLRRFSFKVKAVVGDITQSRT